MTRFLIMSFLLLSSLTPAWAGQGWYLMMPPEDTADYFGHELKAPFSKWQIVQSYDSAKQCEIRKGYELNKQMAYAHQLKEEQNKRPRLKEGASKEEQKKWTEEWAQNFDVIHEADRVMDAWGAARCIASDDPRLKP